MGNCNLQMFGTKIYHTCKNAIDTLPRAYINHKYTVVFKLLIVKILDKELSFQNPSIFLIKLTKSIRNFDFCYFFFYISRLSDARLASIHINSYLHKS